MRGMPQPPPPPPHFKYSEIVFHSSSTNEIPRHEVVSGLADFKGGEGESCVYLFEERTFYFNKYQNLVIGIQLLKKNSSKSLDFCLSPWGEVIG